MTVGFRATLKRELLGYFQTPVAYVFIAIFLLIGGSATFYISHFFERNEASLASFFIWHPWLYLFLIPAITMRLWAEERRSGTFELLMTLPISIWELVLGKFFAAWIFTAIALMGSMTMWWTVNYLGNPDNSIIFGGYLTSLLMAGGYIAIGSCMSTFTRNQVIAFVMGASLCMAFTMFGFPAVIGMFQSVLPQPIIETLSLFSFITNFEDMIKGIIELRALLYFTSLILLFLFLTVVSLEKHTV